MKNLTSVLMTVVIKRVSLALSSEALADQLRVCVQAFARAHDCKRHELLHLGVRKYHCTLLTRLSVFLKITLAEVVFSSTGSPCKRDFVRLDALHRHRKFSLSPFHTCFPMLRLTWHE